MDLITVIIIGVIVAATGVINPKAKDTEEVVQAPDTQVLTPEVKEPEPEPEPEPQKEEPKEEVNAQPNQEQDAKPEEEEVQPVTEEATEVTEEKGLSMVNILLYILGAIAVIAAGIYFFMRREPTQQSAADIGRAQSEEPTPEPQEKPVQEEAPSEPEQPDQEETQTETTEEQPQTDTSDQSSTNDDEDNNR